MVKSTAERTHSMVLLTFSMAFLAFYSSFSVVLTLVSHVLEYVQSIVRTIFFCLFVRTLTFYWHNLHSQANQVNSKLSVRGGTGNLLRGIDNEVVRGRAI